jgi:hypothetical protein
MRRLMAISAFALFLAVPMWAQHGGGHAGGGGGHVGGFGGHASFGGSHGGGFSGGHVSSGMRSGPMASRGFSGRSAQRSFSNQPFLHNGIRNNSFNRNGFNRGFHGNHIYIHTYGFRNPCYGYACRGYGRGYGWPWGWGAYYNPWAWNWWNSDSSYDNDYYNNLAIANQMNQDSLAEQQMFRQQESDGYGDLDSYADRSSGPRGGSRSANATANEAQGAPIIPPTVLVFRDQHKQEVHNYAIVGQTLWNFAPQRTEKIPLADLDLAATTKANDDRGITFRVPSPGEGQ